MAYPETEYIEFARLKKVTGKICRYESHKQFLLDCINSELIPTGFDIKWKMDLETNSYEAASVSDILHKASLSLMSESVAVCDRVLKEAQQLKMDYETKLSSLISKPQFDKNLCELTDFSLKMKIDLLRTKKRKLKLLRTRKISADDQCLLLIEKDGNCFFRCIAAGIFDDPEKHELVRTSVTNHMLDNESTYKNYIDGNYDVHISCMKQSDGNSRSWATEAEILAASTLYDVDIYVKQYSNGCFSWLRFPVERESPNRKFICMRLENQHFDFIRQHERPTSVITKETTLSSEEVQTTWQKQRRNMTKTK